jgi:hypothetical protein
MPNEQTVAIVAAILQAADLIAQQIHEASHKVTWEDRWELNTPEQNVAKAKRLVTVAVAACEIGV